MMIRRSKFAVALFLCSVQTVILFGVQDASSGAISPCTDNTHQFDGGSTTFQSSIYGDRANIENWNPSLCGSDSGVSAWAMVTADDRSNPHSPLQPVHYAQAGYGQWGTTSGYAISGYHTFAEWTKGCNPTCVPGPQYLSAATRNCPETATKLPADGHENCPLTVMGSARHDVVCLAALRG